MSRALLLTLLLLRLCAAPAFAVDRITLFLDRMDGFETYIERALNRAELEFKIELVEEEEHPDLKAMLGKRFNSVYAEALYRKNTGRTENTRITVIDVKSKKTLLEYDFQMGGGDAVKQKNADEFVSKLDGVLKKR